MNSSNNSTRIKVLYVQVPRGGGSMIALYEMVKHLDKNLVDPVILCFYKNKFSAVLESITSCRVIYLCENEQASPKPNSLNNGGKIFNYFIVQFNALKSLLFYERWEAKKVLRILKNERPDIVHHNNDILLNRSCIIAARKAGIKQVVHHRSLTGYGNNLVHRCYDLLLMKNVLFRINITRAVADHFNKLFPTGSRNSAVVPDMIDVKKYAPAVPDIALKNEFGITDNCYTIACIGRLTHWKGQHVLIEAIKRLNGQTQNIKVLMVGPDEDGVGSQEYANALKKMVINSNLHEKIIFTGNRDDVAALINLSDLVVHTSVKPEPQGMVIAEALLCKKSVIASEGFGSGELVDKYGGATVEAGNAEALATLLRECIDDRHSSNGFSETKYEKLKADFDPYNVAEALMDVYKKVVKAERE